CHLTAGGEHAAQFSSLVMTQNSSRGDRLVEDRHLVNLPREPIAGRVEDAAPANVDIKGRIAIISRRAASLPRQRAVKIGLQRSPVGNGRDMMPFVIWKRVSSVQRAPAWSPDFNRGRIDKPVLDRVVL